MKSLTMQTMFAAAVLTVAAGSALAQTYNAEIPVAFRAGDTMMQPGTYRIDVVAGRTGAPVVYIRSRETSKSVILMPAFGSDAPKVWRENGKPMLSFACYGETCSLERLWDGTNIATYKFATPHKSLEVARADTVTVALSKAD